MFTKRDYCCICGFVTIKSQTGDVFFEPPGIYMCDKDTTQCLLRQFIHKEFFMSIQSKNVRNGYNFF